MKVNTVLQFLKESNNIEDVWDDDSLMQAKYAWDYVIKQKEMSPGVVLKTHKILMLHRPLMPDEKGYFRKCAVYIGGREGKPWFALPELVAEWCLKVNSSEDWKQTHVDFETIHPFIDGNGRVGRLLMLWQMNKKNLPIKIIYEKEKWEYYKWFG